MKKINIVKSNEDFNNIIKTGRQVKNKYFIIYYLENEYINYRIGITVSKKCGNAVVRNKQKRQLKSIIDDNYESLKKYDYIVIVRNTTLELNFKEKEKALIELISKI